MAGVIRPSLAGGRDKAGQRQNRYARPVPMGRVAAGESDHTTLSDNDPLRIVNIPLDTGIARRYPRRGCVSVPRGNAWPGRERANQKSDAEPDYRLLVPNFHSLVAQP